MSHTQSLKHARAGRLTPRRLGLRVREGEFDPSPGALPAAAEFARDDFAPGTRALAGFEIDLAVERRGIGVELRPRLRNVFTRPLEVDSLIFGLRWSAPTALLRFLQNGWQSWSFTGVRDLDAAGEREFPSGAWLRGMHHALGAPPEDRAGWHESHGVGVVGESAGGSACLAGVLETGLGFGVVYLRARGTEVELEIEVVCEQRFDPGEERALESVLFSLGEDPSRLLEGFAGTWGRRAEARTRAPFQTGWCSWYHFFHDVTEADVLRNLEALSKARDELPVDVVQIDDGYQRAIGDWLDTNEKFPSGLAALAKWIREAGFTPGLWTAPFCAVSESELFGAHRDWMLRDEQGEPFRGLVHAAWSEKAVVYSLDPTHPGVQQHLEGLFRELVSQGFPYLKLDFLYVAAMRSAAHDPAVSRAARLRMGLDAVRRGAGEAAFLLGCGCPMGPAVGVVDGMRIGPDVAPAWHVDRDQAIPGLEPALPSLQGALRSTLHRAWMHRRLWLNDPDCLMARRSQTQLLPEEAQTLAGAIAVTGGMCVFSDDVALLSAADRRSVRETVTLAREVDESAASGAARKLALLADTKLEVVRAGRGRDSLVSLANLSDTALDVDCDARALDLAPGHAEPSALLETRPFDGLRVELPAHESRVFRVEGARQLVVFCDFDGTFAVQDVGATLAKRHAGDRRPALWGRYESGELTAWDYNMILLDGLELPEKALLAFLETVELDPGAKPLVKWCSERGVPFRILSDGFDFNLDRLQELNDVRFEYTANRLRYEGDLWRIDAVCPNPDCFCGTGACKRGWIESYRKDHPGSFCIHVGNGAVSDLCGAIEADLAFAKDSLAPALAERGVAYEPFETLDDVIAALERLEWS